MKPAAGVGARELVRRRGAGTGWDARLAPPALAVWVATWAGLNVAPSTSYLLAVLSGSVAVTALIVRRLRWAPIVLLAAGCGAIAAVLIGLRVSARDASPLAALAERRASVVLRVSVAGDPVRLRPSFGAPRVLVPAHLMSAQAGLQSWRLRGSVLVLAPAADWARLVPSQRVTVHGGLLRPRGGDLTVAVITARGPPLAVGRPSRVQRAATRLRAGLQRAASGLPGDARALLPGLVDGDVSAVRPALTNDFRATGLTHLTAVSGANIAIVVGAVLLLARSLTLGPRTCAVLGAVAMVGFVILARPQPSVLRAAVMGGFALVALATGRARATVPALSATVLILVFAVPELAGSPGFAMSVCATGALLVVAPRLAGALTARRVPRPLALAMAVPAAAHLASAPLIAAISGQVSLVAIPANMLAEPAVAPATVLGVLAAVVSVGSPALARLLAQLAGWPTRWIVAVGVHGAAVPDGVVGWPSGAVGALLLAAVIAAGAVVLSRSGAVRRAALAGCVGAAAAVVPIRIFAGGWPPPGWFFVACDVGQGDGLVLRAGPGEAVVVDTGPDPAVMDGCLRRLGISRVPVLVITHVDADHVGGIAGVFDHRVVGTVLTGPLHIPATGWSLLTATAAAHHRPVHRPAAGTTWRSGDVQCTVLGPVTPAGGPTADNDSALVLRARVAGRTVLLTADTEVAAQRELLLRGVDLRADVLKVPHHGSDHSDPAFLAATGAPLAVLSVGAQNNYGQPAPPILSLLARLGMRIERTDRVGDIAVGVRSGRLVVVTRS